MDLTRDQLLSLRDDGYVVIPGAVPRPLVVEALREINHQLGQRRAQASELDRYADSRDYWNEDTDAPALLDLLLKSPLWWAAQSALGGIGKLKKPKKTQIALRFPSVNDSHGGAAPHVDGFYSPTAPKPISRFTMLAGVMLSDQPDDFVGNLAVYPGTHKTIADYIAKNGTESLRNGLNRAIPMPDEVQIKGKAGDAVIMHYQLAHDKEQNHSHLIRYMAYWRLLHVDADPDVDPCTNRDLVDLWREWPPVAALTDEKSTKASPKKKSR